MLKPMKGSVRLCWNPTVPEVAWLPLIPRLVPVMAGGFWDSPPFQWDKPPIMQDVFFSISISNYQPVMVWAVAVTYYRASEGLHRMKPRLFMFRKVIFEPVSNAGSEQEFQRDCTKTKHAKIQDDKLLFCQGHLCHLSLSMMTWCGYSADSRHSGASPGRGTLHTNPRGRPGHSWPGFGNMWKTRKKSLLGGAMCPSWKMMEFVNGKDDIPYMKWTKTCLKPATR